MKKQIQISEYSADFIQRVKTALVGGDLNAYEIVWNLKEEQEGAQIALQAKRADDAVITDSAQITGKEAKITLKNNIYCVPGLLTIRVQIVCGGSVLTQCQLICDVLEGYEETDIAADDRTPVLTSLIVQANEACANANAAAGRVPSTAELEALKASVENKVDKEEGKGLSEENFTNDLLLKLTSLPESVYSKTEENALIIPTINYTDLDNTYTEGIYRVKKAGYTGTPDEQNSYTVYRDEYFLLIVHQDEYFYQGMPNETDIYQMILSKSGVPKTRISYVQGDWSAWQDYIPTISITQQSAIQSVSSTVTTYTFNPKSYVSPSAAFKINHTGTNTVTFNFAAPSNTSYTNEILVYFKTALDNAVVWGSNVKFTDDEIPTIEAGVYYRIVAEYNPIMSKWVVGIINDGKGE